MTDCPFCTRIAGSGIIAGNDLAAALYDGFPVSAGHTLIVPRRHVADLFALTEEEQAAVWALVAPVRIRNGFVPFTDRLLVLSRGKE